MENAQENTGNEIQIVLATNSTYGDIFKDTWIRYVGYAHQIGKAITPLVTRFWVNGSTRVAGVYVVADTSHKAFNNYEGSRPVTNAVAAAGDTLVWQSFASIILPSYTIHKVGLITSFVLAKTKAAASLGPVQKIIPMMVGIAAIPFMIGPIDFIVEKAMERTYRPLLGVRIMSSGALVKDSSDPAINDYDITIYASPDDPGSPTSTGEIMDSPVPHNRPSLPEGPFPVDPEPNDLIPVLPPRSDEDKIRDIITPDFPSL